MSDEQPTPATTAERAPPAPAAAPAKRRVRRLVRGTLLLLGPLVALAVGGYLYYTSGRVVETDNAYVKADVGIVSAEVAGPISTLNVRENQSVAAGEVLFTVDVRPFEVALQRADAQLAAINDFVE